MRRSNKHSASARLPDRRQSRLLRHFKKFWQLYLLSALPLFLVFLFNYVPMPGIIVAFKNFKFDKGIFGSDWCGFENFKYFFVTNKIWQVLRNSIVYNVLTTVFSMIVNVGLAVLMYEMTSRGLIRFSQIALYAPGFLSGVIHAYIMWAFLKPKGGFVNQILGLFGAEPLLWYNLPDAWWAIAVIYYVWIAGGGVVLFYATLMGADPGLFESAQIDGANWWQRTWYITIPHLQTILCICFITTMGTLLGGNFTFRVLTRDSAALYKTMDNTATYSYRVMMVLHKMGPAAAFGLMMSISGLILVLVTNAIINKIEPDNALF